MLDRLRTIAQECHEVDGVDPLDEAIWRALRDFAGSEGSGGSGGSFEVDSHRLEVAATEQGFTVLLDDALTLAVRPESRRQGYAAALLRNVLDTEPEPGLLSAWSHGDHPGAVALAAQYGFDRVRDLWVMRRATSLQVPAYEVPAGVTVRGYRDGDHDELLRVNAAAFAAHPEQGAMDAADLASRMAEPWWEPADLLVAVDDRAADGTEGGMLGFHWTKVHSPVLGEIYVLGIAPQGQGRGLGRLLSLAGLRHLADRGVDEVHLYVESDNAAAVGLYDRVGFTHAAADTHVMYHRAGSGRRV